METLIAPPVSSGLNRTIKPRLLGMNFGDGYMQSIPDGINIHLMEIEPVWTNITFEEGDLLNEFFYELSGQKFLWKLPREAAPRVWKCSEFSLKEDRTTSTFSAKLMEQPA